MPLDPLIPLGFFVAATVLTALLEGTPDWNYPGSYIPIWLCIAGWFAQELTYFYIFGFASSDESNKGWVVPMNIPYLIHRYGEWTNLVLGESILSLLTAATSKDNKYLGVDFSFLSTFFSALVLVSTMFIQLHSCRKVLTIHISSKGYFTSIPPL